MVAVHLGAIPHPSLLGLASFSWKAGVQQLVSRLIELVLRILFGLLVVMVGEKATSVVHRTFLGSH
jgi:hypothetical protein